MGVYYNSTTPQIAVRIANTHFLRDWQSRGQRFDPAYLHQSTRVRLEKSRNRNGYGIFLFFAKWRKNEKK